MAQHDRYISPFSTRYASDEMQYIFSDDNKFRTWRKLWIALAKAEQKQGLAITDEQIAELEAHKDDVNYEDAIAREKLVRHDVMSHVYAYGLQCPKAKGIIHLGATSCYVGDNTDVIIMREALQLVRKKIIGVLANLAKFADEYKDMPCLAYTHCQPAQLTTVGKRATLWMNELYMDLEEIDHQIGQLALRGVKGTTGTQASFMELFGGDSAKIKAVEADVCAQMGFTKVVPVCGQTYSRKVDYNVLSAVAGLGQSAMKMATDIRLLANFKEMEEPFEKNQIGSSAMPYKRNPMRCERICALSRYLMVDVLNPAMTAGTQWFERTLDDSANKRIAMAEGFLAADAILNILLNVSDGLVVYPKVVRARVMAELPFMASENIMMKAVKKGGDRQELHERLREHAVAAAAVVKQEGKPNDMIARVEADPAFGLSREEIEAELSPEAFTGRSAEQVALVEAYAKAQGYWNDPEAAPRTYAEVIELDLSTVQPSLAGPSRPHDRIPLAKAGERFRAICAERGLDDATVHVEVDGEDYELTHGAIAIAAVTSCTTATDQAMMLATGLMARNAAERGLAPVIICESAGTQAEDAKTMKRFFEACLCTTSQSGLRPPAPLVGEPLAKRQSFAECQGLPSIGEVSALQR